MSYLLDTQAFLWFISGDARLSATARGAIENLAHEKSVGMASAWEIAITASLGKLALAKPFGVLIPDELQRNGFRLLDINLRHVAAVATLSFRHRDPFDRLLVAQTITENLAIVSSDRAFDEYGVARIW
ncbi:MAG: type II toxin-antitoxin system VapC family toxin [Anaerolineae bacterium]|nr:type II toxin-antitoxin system VapC family toxin [Phycisphaerae bacterium]